jgi:transposase-like protein
MKKNRKWDYETKVKYAKQLIAGRSYTSIARELGLNTYGMLGTWKREYLNGTLSEKDNRGKKATEVDDYELLKKCYAQLMKIRSE